MCSVHFVLCITLATVYIARYIEVRNFPFGRNTCKEMCKSYQSKPCNMCHGFEYLEWGIHPE